MESISWLRFPSCGLPESGSSEVNQRSDLPFCRKCGPQRGAGFQTCFAGFQPGRPLGLGDARISSRHFLVRMIRRLEVETAGPRRLVNSVGIPYEYLPGWGEAHLAH